MVITIANAMPINLPDLFPGIYLILMIFFILLADGIPIQAVKTF